MSSPRTRSPSLLPDADEELVKSGRCRRCERVEGRAGRETGVGLNGFEEVLEREVEGVGWCSSLLGTRLIALCAVVVVSEGRVMERGKKGRLTASTVVLGGEK